MSRVGHVAAPARPRFRRPGAAAPAARPAARTAVWLLGAVLALESADLATVGAAGRNIETAFGLSHAELGLLAATSPIAAALATVPTGMLADRRARTPLLAAGVALWGVAMLAAGAATSFAWLLASRAALGALTAGAMPFVLSLSGDYFDARVRARRYARVAAGELVGSGFGFLAGGTLAALLSWRWAFWILAAPAFVLALAIWRGLPEPPREAARAPAGAESLPRAVRYVLSVRTNVVLLLAGAVGNFFYAGVRTFTVVFIRDHYGLSQALATAAMGVLGLGAIAGVLAGGRLADALRARGRRDARMVVAGAASLGAAALWVPPLVFTVLPVGLGVGLLATALMSMPNAPIDAARLDVVPARLRGRAESVRALLRAGAFSVAPLAFGLVADAFGAHGTRGAFLVMLVPLAASGFLLLAGRRGYPRDADRAGAADRRRACAGNTAPRPCGGASRRTA